MLVRSHAKLDSLGIEYGRLGSVVLAWNGAGAAHANMKALLRVLDDTIRLYGTKPRRRRTFRRSPARRNIAV